MLIDKPSQAQEMYWPKDEWPASCPSSPDHIASCLLSFLLLLVSDRLWHVGLAEMKLCVSVLLSSAVICWKRRILYPFLRAQLAGAVAISPLSDQPHPEAGRVGALKLVLAQTIVVSFKIKDLRRSTPLYFLSHRANSVHCVTSLF